MKSKTKKNISAQRRIAQLLPKGYPSFVQDLRKRIRTAQVKASLSANKELILLYWDIGRSILVRQNVEGWGTQVIERLSRDLRIAFPDMSGFSSRNLKYMRAFSEAYPERPFVQQLAAQIPWFHHCLLLDRTKERNERIWYIRQTIAHGWSRNILSLQLENKLHKRQRKAITNFKRTLSSPQSDLAQQTLKNPYIFDFLTPDANVREQKLEQGLLDHIQRLLIELGKGFAFVGRQFHLEVDGEDYYLDLLFYHLDLRCYIVIELKTGPFKPEFAGKMNFYLSAVDSLLRRTDDKPAIGLLLCKDRKHLIVEYALRGMTKPIGVAKWKTKLVTSLPKTMQRSLRTIKELEKELKK